MYLTLCNDVIFRYVFGKEENNDILLDLVNAVLRDKGGPVAASLELMNPIILGDTAWLKEMVLDIKAKDESGRVFNVEMQVVNDSRHHHRSLAYWAGTYIKQLHRGDDYENLRPVICINVLDFTLFADLPESHNLFTIRHTEQADLELTDHLALHFIELGKPAREGSRLATWKAMFKTREPLQEDLMPPLLNDDPVFRKVVKEFKRCTDDDRLHEIAIAREKFQWEQKFYLNNAIQKGLEQGLAQGIQQGLTQGIQQGIEQGRAAERMELARRLAGKGLAIDEIADICGLEPGQVRHLLEERPAH